LIYGPPQAQKAMETKFFPLPFFFFSYSFSPSGSFFFVFYFIFVFECYAWNMPSSKKVFVGKVPVMAYQTSSVAAATDGHLCVC
jgi:hypothetical protein